MSNLSVETYIFQKQIKFPKEGAFCSEPITSVYYRIFWAISCAIPLSLSPPQVLLCARRMYYYTLCTY